jgi:predicted RNA-binding Zn-ribbon protein involved in translation (DUF1610 family)
MVVCPKIYKQCNISTDIGDFSPSMERVTSMILRDDGLICPYCGSVDTEAQRERTHDTVYECDGCNRTFSGP